MEVHHSTSRYPYCLLAPEYPQNVVLLRLNPAASRCQKEVPRLRILDSNTLSSHDVPVIDTTLSDPPLPYQLPVITNNRSQADEERVMKWAFPGNRAIVSS